MFLHVSSFFSLKYIFSHQIVIVLIHTLVSKSLLGHQQTIKTEKLQMETIQLTRWEQYHETSTVMNKNFEFDRQINL